MTTITDAQLVELFTRRWRPVAGSYEAPAATAHWDGHTLTLLPTGVPLDAAAAVRAPHLALALNGPQQRAAPPRELPAIAALEADYAAATAPHAAWWPVAPQTAFLGRLAACRACELWNEAERGGRGRCGSTRAGCDCRRLWAARERCPEGLWPA